LFWVTLWAREGALEHDGLYAFTRASRFFEGAFYP
jgi:hypothetical protein